MSLSPQKFDVVLFNTNSREVKAKERYEAIEYVLNQVCEETSENVFVLSQENIIIKCHKLICKLLSVDPKAIPRKEEAAAYYKKIGNDGTEHFTVSYPNTSDLAQLDDAKHLNSYNSNFSFHRLTAVILTQRSNEKNKLLLVSWHGHHNKKGELKEEDFERLVTILDKFKGKNECTVAIVGGDFNMSAAKAKNSNALKERKGIVLDDYEPTEDRIPEKRKVQRKIDYVILWPNQEHYNIHCHVTCREYKRDKGKRPFDHNIIVYSFLYDEPVVGDGDQLGVGNRIVDAICNDLGAIAIQEKSKSPVDAQSTEIKQTSNRPNPLNDQLLLELTLDILPHAEDEEGSFVLTQPATTNKDTLSKELKEKLKSRKVLCKEEEEELDFLVSLLLQDLGIEPQTEAAATGGSEAESTPTKPGLSLPAEKLKSEKGLSKEEEKEELDSYVSELFPDLGIEPKTEAAATGGSEAASTPTTPGLSWPDSLNVISKAEQPQSGVEAAALGEARAEATQPSAGERSGENIIPLPRSKQADVKASPSAGRQQGVVANIPGAVASSLPGPLHKQVRGQAPHQAPNKQN